MLLRRRAAVGRHRGVRSTSHSQGTIGSPSRRVRPVLSVAHSLEEEFSEGRVVMKAKGEPASCVKHENCLVSPEELIHLGPALGLIAFLGCVDILVRRVRTLAAI